MSAPPTSVCDWFASPLGRALLVREQIAVRQALGDVFGAYLLQVGSWGASDAFLAFARTQRSALLAEPGGQGDLMSHASALAVSTASVDGLLLPHTLEFEPEPHAVLREAERVLVGEGHLIIVGFAPGSPWDLAHRLWPASLPPGMTRLWSARRVTDWLEVLGFEVQSVHPYLGLWPSQRLVDSSVSLAMEGVAGRVGALTRPGSRLAQYPWPLAGAYLLKARKRLYTLTRVVRTRRRAARLSTAMARPVARISESCPLGAVRDESSRHEQ